MTDLPRFEVDYCAYQWDLGYKKPTAIWSNIDPTCFTPRKCRGIDCPATITGTRKHQLNGFRDSISTEMLYRIPAALLRDLMYAARKTIGDVDAQRLVQANYVDLSDTEIQNPLPSFQSLIETLFPPEVIPEFMLTPDAYFRFGLTAFNELCHTGPSKNAQCYTAFVGDAKIPPKQIKYN